MKIDDLLNADSDNFWKWWAKPHKTEEYRPGIVWVKGKYGRRDRGRV